MFQPWSLMETKHRFGKCLPILPRPVPSHPLTAQCENEDILCVRLLPPDSSRSSSLFTGDAYAPGLQTESWAKHVKQHRWIQTNIGFQDPIWVKRIQPTGQWLIISMCLGWGRQNHVNISNNNQPATSENTLINHWLHNTFNTRKSYCRTIILSDLWHFDVWLQCDPVRL